MCLDGGSHGREQAGGGGEEDRAGGKCHTLMAPSILRLARGREWRKQGEKVAGDKKKKKKNRVKRKRLSRIASSAGSLGLLIFSLFSPFQIPVVVFFCVFFLSPPPPGGLAGYSLNSYDYFRKR